MNSTAGVGEIVLGYYLGVVGIVLGYYLGVVGIVPNSDFLKSINRPVVFHFKTHLYTQLSILSHISSLCKLLDSPSSRKAGLARFQEVSDRRSSCLNYP